MSVAARVLIVRIALDVQFWFPTWFFLLKEQGFSTAEAVEADAIFHAVILVSEIPLGRAVSVIGRARSIQASALGTSAIFVGLAFCNSVPMLFIVWAAWGALWALSSGLDTAYSWEVAESGFVTLAPSKFLSICRLVSGITIGVSLLTAGYLFELDPKLPYLLTAALAFGVFTITLRLPEPTSTRKTAAEERSHLKSFFRGPKTLHLSVLLLGATLTCGVSVRILIQPVSSDTGVSPLEVSIFYTVFSLAISIGSSVGALMGPRMRKGSAWVLLSAFSAIYVPIGMLVDTCQRILYSGALMLVSAFIFGVVRSIAEVKLATSCRPRQRVTMLSIASALSGTVMVIIRPLIMWAYTGWGLVVGFAPAVLACIGFAIAAKLIKIKS